MKRLSLAFLLVFLLPVLAGAAPLDTLDTKGLEKLVAEHQGKVVMLNFFATWCSPCRKEIPDLQKVHKAYENKEVVIIGLSVDDNKGPVPGFLQTLGVTYPVYMADRELTRSFGISSIPFNVFFDRKGKVVLAGTGLLEYAALVEIFDKILEN